MNDISRVCICGSMSVLPKMREVEKELKEMGIEMELPNSAEYVDYADLSEAEAGEHKGRMIQDHIERIKKSDAILVVNETQKGTENYIGANAFLEMGMAFVLGKKIFVLNPLPHQPNKVEMLGLCPTSLDGKIGNILI